MIGGLISCSCNDFPGRLAAVVFLRGCNLRCCYCHNCELLPVPSLRDRGPGALWPLLDARRGLLTGVVVSGGEPTLCAQLPDLLTGARSRGYATKLDTNGTQPAVVRQLVRAGLVGLVAVDVKAISRASSQWLCGAGDQGSGAVDLLEYLVGEGVPVEARTTVMAPIHTAGELEGIALALDHAGVRRWRLQAVAPRALQRWSPRFVPPSAEVLTGAVRAAAVLGIDAAVRGALPARRMEHGDSACDVEVGIQPCRR